MRLTAWSLSRALVAVLFLGPSVAAASDVTTWDASLRAEQQVRAFNGAGKASPAASLELFPTLGAARRIWDTTLSLTYTPQILFGDLAGTIGKPSYLHQGRFVLEHRFAPDRRMSVTENGSYGTADFITLSQVAGTSAVGAAPPRLQALPTLAPLPYGNTSTDGLIDWGFDLRTRGTLVLNYQLGGGLGSARSQLPLQSRVQGTASLAHVASRVDTVTTQVLANHTSFDTGQVGDVGEVTEVWRRRVDRTTELTLGLGASVVRSGPSPLQIGAPFFFPAGQLGIKTRSRCGGHRFDFEALATLDPYLDWITGIAYERADVSAAFRWTDPQDRWGATLRGRGAFAVAPKAQQGQPVASVDASAVYAPRSDLKVEVGSRFLWQRIPAFGDQPFWEWLTFASFTVTAKGIL